jgi:hypothetical protein
MGGKVLVSRGKQQDKILENVLNSLSIVSPIKTNWWRHTQI